jgi:hypothetical protein
MKGTVIFVAHVLLAMLATMVVGGPMCVIVGAWLGKAKNPWFDAPYSPLLWGFAFFLGLFLNWIIPTHSAKWVWTLVGATDVPFRSMCGTATSVTGTVPKSAWGSFSEQRRCLTLLHTRWAPRLLSSSATQPLQRLAVIRSGSRPPVAGRTSLQIVPLS